MKTKAHHSPAVAADRDEGDDEAIVDGEDGDDGAIANGDDGEQLQMTVNERESKGEPHIAYMVMMRVLRTKSQLKTIDAKRGDEPVGFPARGVANSDLQWCFPAMGVAAATPRPHVASPLHIMHKIKMMTIATHKLYTQR